MGIRYGRASTDPLPPLLLRRSLEVLNATLKEFINMKMLTGVKTMARVRHKQTQIKMFTQLTHIDR